MLTTLLVLAATALAQDGAAPPVAPAPAAPAQDAPAAQGPAPAVTSPEVRSFLTDAEKQLYDPQAAGLKTVEFDATVEMPKLGPVGSVHVTWAAGGEPTISFVRDEAAELPPNVPGELVSMSGEQFGRDFLDQMLNRPITPMLRDGTAAMCSPQDGMVRISIASATEQQQRIKEHSLFFNEDGLLQKSKMVVDTAGSGMPFETLPITEVYTWKATGSSGDALVADVRSGEQDYGMFGKEKTTTTFSYTTVGDLVVLTGMAVDSDRPAMLGGREQRQVALRNLVVNGKAAEVTAPPAAAAPPAATPAAPADSPASDPAEPGAPR